MVKPTSGEFPGFGFAWFFGPNLQPCKSLKSISHVSTLRWFALASWPPCLPCGRPWQPVVVSVILENGGHLPSFWRSGLQGEFQGTSHKAKIHIVMFLWTLLIKKVRPCWFLGWKMRWFLDVLFSRGPWSTLFLVRHWVSGMSSALNPKDKWMYPFYILLVKLLFLGFVRNKMK